MGFWGLWSLASDIMVGRDIERGFGEDLNDRDDPFYMEPYQPESNLWGSVSEPAVSDQDDYDGYDVEVEEDPYFDGE